MARKFKDENESEINVKKPQYKISSPLGYKFPSFMNNNSATKSEDTQSDTSAVETIDDSGSSRITEFDADTMERLYGGVDNGDIVEMNANKGIDISVDDTTGSVVDTSSTPFQQMLEKYLSGANSQFKFDLNGEELYQQYKDQYVRGGQMAMMDTMGQAAGLTGGYGSSYAQSVGQQAYQGYMNDLNAVVPDVYNAAYQRWQDERANELEKLQLYENYYGTDGDGTTIKSGDTSSTASTVEYPKGSELASASKEGLVYNYNTGVYEFAPDSKYTYDANGNIVMRDTSTGDTTSQDVVVDESTGKTEQDMFNVFTVAEKEVFRNMKEKELKKLSNKEKANMLLDYISSLGLTANETVYMYELIDYYYGSEEN